MRRRKVIFFTVLLLATFATQLFGCAGEPELEPVVTLGIPEKEKVVETIQTGDFIFNIYPSYAELQATRATIRCYHTGRSGGQDGAQDRRKGFLGQ